MGENDDNRTAWALAFKEQLSKHPDPTAVQQEAIRILLEMLPAPAPAESRAKNTHDVHARAGFLAKVFGKTARVQILEALLQHPGDWFNLADIAAIAHVGKASAKRIVDELATGDPRIVEGKPAAGPGKERLVRLADTAVTKELEFFYIKIKGIL
jgi:hypothetical protein